MFLELFKSARTSKFFCNFLLSNWLCYAQKLYTKAVCTHMYVFSTNKCLTLEELGGNWMLTFTVEIPIQEKTRVSTGPRLRSWNMRSQKRVLGSRWRKQTGSLPWSLPTLHKNSSERSNVWILAQQAGGHPRGKARPDSVTWAYFHTVLITGSFIILWPWW